MLAHSGSRTRWRAAGFSLSEFMVTTAIVGITAAVAAPNMIDMISSYRVRSAAESALNGLQFARAEAVRTNATVNFTIGGSNDGQWSVTNAANAEIARSAKEGGSAISVQTTGGSSVTFNGRGRVVGAGLTRAQFKPNPAQGNKHAMQIDVLIGGQVRMCDPNVTANGDPRRC